MKNQQDALQPVFTILATLRSVLPPNIAINRLTLLINIRDSEALCMTDIANFFGYSTSAATGAIDRLEKLELVKRIKNPPNGDRRKVIVALTDLGLALVAETASKLKQIEKGRSVKRIDLSKLKAKLIAT